MTEWTLALIPPPLWQRHVVDLANDAQIARRRGESASPGDRREAIRHHRLADRIEALARRWLVEGHATAVAFDDTPPSGDSWWQGVTVSAFPEAAQQHLAAGGAVVALADPFGALDAEPPIGAPVPPSPRRSGIARDMPPAAALLDAQLRAALEGDQPVVPSGVPNHVLTEGLRRYAERANVTRARPARVVYRDGSEAAPFPLGALDAAGTAPSSEPDLRCALISLRHPEMDPLVDFAWIRNRVASQVRPAAETDRLVHEHSRERLAALRQYRSGAVLEVFQTGLEPAIVGFYRALAEHLAEHPGSIVVRPRYFEGGVRYGHGAPWWSA